MRYSLHEIDTHDVVATTVAADRDEALELFSENLRLMLAADYLLDDHMMYELSGIAAHVQLLD
jgi:CheY-like chemotaxis protein